MGESQSEAIDGIAIIARPNSIDEISLDEFRDLLMCVKAFLKGAEIGAVSLSHFWQLFV